METANGRVRFLCWLGSNELGDWVLLGVAAAVVALWVGAVR
jgi:hypothetical protein